MIDQNHSTIEFVANLFADDPSDDEHESISSEEELLYCLQSSDSSDTSTDSPKPRRKLHRIENYVEVIKNYDDKEFKENFRLERSTCHYLIQKIEEGAVVPSHKSGRKKICAEVAVYMTIWYLANTETFRQVSDRFNVTKSSAFRVISRIVNYLINHCRDYIVWPNETRRDMIRRKFEEKQGIHGVIGAVDGSHIPIKKPNSKYAHVYYNRKGYYSILLQGVCDHSKKFIDAFCGEAGSIHDARLLKKSVLYEKGINGALGNDILLGDSAYPCLTWLIPPFKDNGQLTENQKIFNYKHSSTRIIIENAFGLLKGRFRRLRYFDNGNIMFIVRCVIAAIVLHNICIDFDDEIEAIDDEHHEDDDELFVQSVSGIQSNQTKRDEIFQQMFRK